ncbi:hypothetical protein FALBO_8300 [Fusarium albosuccineum]|uniref:Uncharacterized protein n=1 Tax=Fusarium albosuccineum TaxID=1237068 RepID=A0A8H4PBP0_9HYPO|nr:hypothetical protein FALBO_8300 [Fusarium albosuccineum]
MLSLQHHLCLWLFSFLSLPCGYLYTCLANYTDLPTTPSEVMEHVVIGLTVYLLLHFIPLPDGQPDESKSPTSERRQKKRIKFAHGITIVPYHPDDTPKDTRLDELEYGKLTESNDKPTESNGKTTKSNGKPAESSAGAIEPKQQNGKPKGVQQDESGSTDEPSQEDSETSESTMQKENGEKSSEPGAEGSEHQEELAKEHQPQEDKEKHPQNQKKQGKRAKGHGKSQENKAKGGKQQQANTKSGQGSKSSQKKKGKGSKLQTETTTDAEAKNQPRDLPPEIPRPILRKRPRRRFGWFGRWWDPL